MANVKITALNNLASADVADGDVFVIDDITATETKKITIANLSTAVGAAGFTVSRALVSDGSGDIAVSDVTATEIGYLDGVSSAVQTQIDTKIATTASASNDYVTYARLNANVNVVSANSTAVEARRAANNTLLTAEDTALQARIAANTLVAASNDFVTYARLNANLNTTTANVTAVETRRTQNIAGAISTVTTGDLATSRALASDGSGKIAASAVTATELGYLDGVSSAVQTQIDTKIATTTSASNDFVTYTRLNANLNTTTANVTAVETRRTQNIAGAVSTVTTSDLTASRAMVTNGSGKIAISDVTATELGYLDGVSSAIQTQLGTKIATTDSASNDYVTYARVNANVNVVSANTVAVETRRTQNIAGAISTVTTSDLTADRAVISNGSGKLAISAVTSTELGYLDGVSSALQTQLDAKAALAGATFSGQVNMSDDLVVTGNLSVHGTTFTANAENLVVQDQFIALSNGGTSSMDVGIFYNRGTEGNAAVWYDASDSSFYLSETKDPFSNTTVKPTSAANLNVGALTATSFTGSGAGLTAGTTPLTTLDIDGATDIGEAIVDADLFIIDNGAGGTNRKVAASRLKTYTSAAAAAGDLTGSTLASGVTASSLTSVGTLTTLTVDDIIINGANIGHTSDTDAIAISSGGVVTFSQTPVFSLDVTIGDDIFLDSDSGSIYFGDDAEVRLSHVHNEGLRLNDTYKMMFGNADDLKIYHDGTHSYINDAGTGQLRLLGSQISLMGGTDGAETMATFVDDGSATLYHDNGARLQTTAAGVSVTGTATMSGNVIIADAGNIGSASDTDAIAISSGGVVTMNQIPVFSAGINVSGGTIAGTLATAAQGNITSLGTLTTLTVDDITINGSTISDGGDLTIDVAGDITLDAGGGDINFKDDGTAIATFEKYDVGNGGLRIITHQSDADIVFRINDGGSAMDVMTIDSSDAGTVILQHDLNLDSDGAIIYFGEDQDVQLEHVADTGLRFPDDDKMIWGTGSDLAIYHDGSNSYIDEASGTGSLIVKSNQFIVRNAAGSENMFDATQDGAINIYYDNAAKLTTSAAGVTVSGGIIIADAGNIGSASDTDAMAIASDGKVTFSQAMIVQNQVIATSLDISGDVDIDGTTNLDAVDIDGAVQADGTITVGVDDTGYDVKFFGATSGKYMLWDESADSLILVGNVGIGLTSPQTLVHIHDSGTGGSDLLRLTTGDTGSGSSDGFKVHYESDLDICYMNLEQGDHKWYTHNGSSVSDRMILSDAGNLSLTGDFSLKHDGAVLYFGADNDVSLTHIADNGLRLPDSRAMYFGDDTDLQIYHTGSAGFINNATGDLTVDVAGDIILDADGGDIIFKDGGTTIGTFANNSNNLRIVSNVSDADLILRGVDGGAAINALTLDMSEGGAGLFVAGIGVLGGSVAANIGVNVPNEKYIAWFDSGTSGGTAAYARGVGGALHFGGGSYVFNGDVETDFNGNVKFSHDGAILYFGNDDDVYLEHVADTGLRFPDGDKLIFGTGSDLNIFHDGSNSYVHDSGTGQLYLATSALHVTNNNATESMIYAAENGAVTLYYDNTAALATVSGGVNITGGLTITDNMHLDHDGVILHFGDDNDVTLTHVADTGILLNSTRQIQFNDASQYICGASATQLDIRATDEIELTATDVDLNGNLRVSNDAHLDHDGALLYFGADSEISFEHVHNAGLKMNGHLYFADNKVAYFGTSSDLQIYHDGSNSHITDQGTGVLAISTNGTQISIQKDTAGEAMAYFKVDGAVELYYDNAKKLETTSSGVTVTGTVVDSAGGGMVPPGTVLPYTGASAPTGFVLCDDSAISRTTYSVLFAIIGTSYGTGNGTTTFNVPDLRDRLPLGKGTNNSSLGAITAAAGASAVVATASGSASLTKTTGTFATSAKDSSQASALTNVTSGGHTHNLTLPAQVFNYIIKT